MTDTMIDDLEELCAEIRKAHVEDLLKEAREPSRQPYFYLSGLHTCARHLFYLLTDGEKRPPVDPYVLGLFRSGRIWEQEVKADFNRMRIEIMKAGEEVLINYAGAVKELRGQLIGKGKIDGVVKWRGVEYPAEIKSMDGNMFKRLNTADDLLKFEHTEKYMRQLLMYQYGKNIEKGLFILSDCRSHLKPIPVYLGNHLEVAEGALKNMERAWEAKHRGEPPERITFHHSICGRCAFATICLPTQVIEGAERVDDPEIEAMIARHEELAPAAKEYDELHDNVKDLFAGKPRTTVGGKFEVTVGKQTRKKLDKTRLTNEQVAAATVSYDVETVKIKSLTEKA